MTNRHICRQLPQFRTLSASVDSGASDSRFRRHVANSKSSAKQALVRVSPTVANVSNYQSETALSLSPTVSNPLGERQLETPSRRHSETGPEESERVLPIGVAMRVRFERAFALVGGFQNTLT